MGDNLVPNGPFSSREALAAAVYHREVDELVAIADTIDRSDGSVEALRQ